MIYIMKWSTILHTLPYCIALVLCIELEYAFICSFIHLFNKYLLNMYFVQITLLMPPLSLLPDPSLSSHRNTARGRYYTHTPTFTPCLTQA